MKKCLLLCLLFLAGSCGKDRTVQSRKVEITRVVEYTSLTITNYTNAGVDLSGWKLVEEISFFTTTTKEYVFQPVSIPAGGSVSFTASQLGFRLQKPDEMLYLYNPAGQLSDQMSWVSFE